jgi:hypothetical protein
MAFDDPIGWGFLDRQNAPHAAFIFSAGLLIFCSSVGDTFVLPNAFPAKF